MGCASAPSGPTRIDVEGASRPYYARSGKVDHWRNRMSFTDEVSGQDVHLAQPMNQGYRMKRLDGATYEREVRAARERYKEGQQRILDRRSSYEALEREEQGVKLRAQQRDWQWWYDAFRAQGYPPDEAASKATEVSRGP